MLKVVQRFGYSPEEFDLQDFTKEPSFISMQQGRGYIEVMNRTLGVSFDECYSNREIIETSGMLVNFISLPDLIRNKKAVGRSKDWIDIDNLPKI